MVRCSHRFALRGRQPNLGFARAIVGNSKRIFTDGFPLGFADVIVARFIPVAPALAWRNAGTRLVEQFSRAVSSIAHRLYAIESAASYSQPPLLSNNVFAQYFIALIRHIPTRRSMLVTEGMSASAALTRRCAVPIQL